MSLCSRDNGVTFKRSEPASVNLLVDAMSSVPATYKGCRPNTRRCGESVQCISVMAFCDGVNDCKNHYDENPERCGDTLLSWEMSTITHAHTQTHTHARARTHARTHSRTHTHYAQQINYFQFDCRLCYVSHYFMCINYFVILSISV